MHAQVESLSEMGNALGVDAGTVHGRVREQGVQMHTRTVESPGRTDGDTNHELTEAGRDQRGQWT